MGNCLFRGFVEAEQVIKVVTSNGGVMELYPPVTAECITKEFPDHGIFPSPDLNSQPLLHKEQLVAGQLYYLRPLGPRRRPFSGTESSLFTRYRISFGNQGIWRKVETEVFPRYKSEGVWKVKLSISPAELMEILSQESGTEALIQSGRTVAKCGSGSSSTSNSDQWSLDSSRKVLSENLG